MFYYIDQPYKATFPICFIKTESEALDHLKLS